MAVVVGKKYRFKNVTDSSTVKVPHYEDKIVKVVEYTGTGRYSYRCIISDEEDTYINRFSVNIKELNLIEVEFRIE